MWWLELLWSLMTDTISDYQTVIKDTNRNIIRSFEDRSVSYKNDSYAYITRFKVFDVSCDDCDVLVHFFAGSYLGGDRYDHSPLMQYVSLTRRVQPWSIDYRLLDQGTSYEEIVNDAVAALTFLRQRIAAHRKIVVLGSSSGADLAMRAAAHTDGIILDSGWFCFPSKNIKPLAASVVRNSDAYKCYEQPVVPTFVLHGEKDTIIVPKGAKEYARRYASVRLCVAEGGEHIVAFSQDCNTMLNAWIDEMYGWEKVESRLPLGDALSRSYSVFANVNSYLVGVLPKPIANIFVRDCSKSLSPIEAYDVGCRGEPDTF